MKWFKTIGVLSLLSFSFFLTDFVTELAINNDPLMQSIKENSNYNEIKSVNAIIENNTIIPGIKGKKVNIMESYLNMKDFGTFNDNYLIYDSIIPDINVNDNLDKIIISGNNKHRRVSILIKNNLDILNYSKSNIIKYTKLINKKEDFDTNENINICSKKEDFNDLNILLNKNNLNKKICILNYSNISECKNKKYYIVKPNIELENNNFISNLNNISNGSIIMINENLNINNYKILIDYLGNKDLEVIYLSELIKE